MADMWFGNKQRMQWVPAPSVNPGMSKVGWSSKSQYLNGGASVRRSTVGHREYSLSWTMKHQEDIRKITDYADGVYGDDLIYWLNPFTLNTNVLPQMWATPALAANDGISIVASGDAPQTLLTPANQYGYPAYTAAYTVTTSNNPTLWLPIPPGYRAWVACVGNQLAGDTGHLTILPDVGPNQSTNPTSVVDPTPYSIVLDGDVTPGFTMRLGTSTAGLIHITALMVQMLPKGTEPVFTGFISGQGHSGCKFGDEPVLSPYSAALDRAGVSVNLIEVESWQ